MKNESSKNNTRAIPVAKQAAPVKKTNRNFWKYFIIALILILAIYVLTKPLRSKASKEYVSKGDSFLAQNKYVSADLEYEKALELDSKNELATQRKTLADNASKNVITLESFYKENNYPDQLNKLKQAENVPQNATDAVILSKQLIQSGQYQLAAISAKNAVEMASNYRDAWVYLGLSYKEIAQNVELRPDVASGYMSQSNDAFAKVKQLDPEYKI
jgi:tetratricopeptide (TPR) repeat protein